MIKLNSVVVRCFLFLIISMSFASCGSFGEGLLMGLANWGSSLNYGSNYSYSGTSSNSNDYLLDPNYTIAQTMSQYNQLNKVHETIAKQSVDQTFSQEDQEYQTFCKYNKKRDGTNYSKNEWRALKGQVIQQSNSKIHSELEISSNNESVENRSTSYKCRRISASDYAHCNDTGICPMCNGAKRYYDTSVGLSRWVDPCVVCGGTGKCPTCGIGK